MAGSGNPAGTPGSVDTATVGAAGVVTINTGQSVLNLNNNAGQITIDAFGLNLVGGGSTTNTGIINIGGASTANLGVSASHNINNAGGVINVAAGSVVNQFGSTITGGTINTTGGGALVAFNSGSNFISGVMLNGTLDLASGVGIERVTGGLTLNGTINVGSGSVLAPQGDQTIGGSGNIVFADNNGSNRLNVEAGNLTLASGITVHGNTGLIGAQNFAGGAASLTNNGNIAADVAGGTITLGVNGTVTNNGTLAASNGGTLVLNNSIVGNVGSQITVGAGSTILQNGVTLNGVINNAGTGSFRASNSGSNFLNAANFTGRS
ncbi:MAG: hypothetical protein IPJ48_11180 [Propionivibrio sp.]|uniref:S-layer family protein n=1 Tax=Candidatus Propionivibrio dominans TaxID=2954373 RepID=A0A9D7F7T0_9RHOO|nr:hypothetical protein [Candidatus Propionivibrio dominans]